MNTATRKMVRLQNYDYAQNGAYFLTICTQNKRKLFWNGNEPFLNPQGDLVRNWIEAIPTKFSGVYVDCFVVMPNHVHLLLFLDASATDLSKIMKWWKTVTTNDYIRGVKEGRFPPFELHLWQRSYYEHVIRNDLDLKNIREYIANNPVKWTLDEFY